MKKTLITIAFFAMALAGCTRFSHNAAVLVMGEKAGVGSVEYGEISYLSGLALVDLSRENSEWEIEVDEQNGIQYDSKTGGIRGIRKIRRRIGRQITGYLVDLAKKDAEAAKEWVKPEERKDADTE